MIVNIPLVQALEHIRGYAKLMTDLINKKRTINYEEVDSLHHCNAITSQYLVQKKGDPKAFTIPYTIGSSRFIKALCYFGARIKLIPLAVYK